MLTVSFVTGTEPNKWFERFREATAHGGLQQLPADDAFALMESGAADVALTRLPDPRVGDDHHVVRLYEETPGVAVPKDSIFAEVGEKVPGAEIADETLNYRIGEDGEVDVEALRTALQVVAANVGVAVAPRPLLKVLCRKQVVHLELVDASVPRTHIGLVWKKSADSDAIQDFVGVAKGRTRLSSRQASASTPPRKLSAREKTPAKQARRAKQGKRRR